MVIARAGTPVARLVVQYRDVVANLGAVELEISSVHALRSGGLRWGRRDPFDRMLVAQAMLTGSTLVSRDRAFHDLPALDVLW